MVPAWLLFSGFLAKMRTSSNVSYVAVQHINYGNAHIIRKISIKGDMLIWNILMGDKHKTNLGRGTDFMERDFAIPSK